MSPHQSFKQDLITEITDGQSRTNNIIIFNIQETNSSSHIIESNYDQISKMDTNNSIDILCSRLGNNSIDMCSRLSNPNIRHGAAGGGEGGQPPHQNLLSPFTRPL